VTSSSTSRLQSRLRHCAPKSSPTSSLPTGPCATLSATPKEQHPHLLHAPPRNSALHSFSTKTIARLSPRAVLADFQSCSRIRRHPSKSASIAAAIHVHGRSRPITKNRFAAAQPLRPHLLGNADSGGPESLTSESVRLSQIAPNGPRKSSPWGNPNAKALAQKALQPVPMTALRA